MHPTPDKDAVNGQQVKHLLGVSDLSRDQIEQLIDRATYFWDRRQSHQKEPTLKGRSVVNLFFESSTRTRTSFELAGKRLSADVVNISTSTSSVTKGETLLDTVRTIEAMRPDVVVIRHGSSGAPHYVAERVQCSVINAGDGSHEHPTQALLDAFTVKRAKGTLSGLTITICGDIAHSRVARSDALLFSKFGSEVRVVGPKTLIPDCSRLGAKVYDDLEKALTGADVVITLRIQKERLAGVYLASMREYSRHYGINERVLAAAKPDVVVMHPGPMNRGVEIDGEVADGGRSLILEQVESGVVVRMAVLEALALRDRA